MNVNALDLDGQSLKALVFDGGWNEREYLTRRYGDTVWYRDHKYWVIIDVSGKPRAVFDIQEDANCRSNIIATSDEVVNRAWRLILQDAGGQLPIYDMKAKTDAVGRKK